MVGLKVLWAEWNIAGWMVHSVYGQVVNEPLGCFYVLLCVATVESGGEPNLWGKEPHRKVRLDWVGMNWIAG